MGNVVLDVHLHIHPIALHLCLSAFAFRNLRGKQFARRDWCRSQRGHAHNDRENDYPSHDFLVSYASALAW